MTEQQKITALVKENEILRTENELLSKLFHTKTRVCNDLCRMIKELESRLQACLGTKE